MEPAGLAVGVIALAGLFNNAVDCFKYVQLGRSFGTNFQTSLLKLDNARLRISRWGAAVGLSGDLEDARSLQGATVNKEDVLIAERTLGQILKLFADAEGISAKYKRFARPDDLTLSALKVHADMDAVGQSLHKKMRKLCIKRQNRSTLYQKAKWALYKEEHFKKLIENIKDLVNALSKLFPDVRQEQLKLCEIKVSEIGKENLSAIIDIVQSQDKDLEAAISAAIKATVSATQTRTSRVYN
jgi:hypothetical protein